MDAHALLTSQGWRGTGHSLHPTSDGTGLSKPLLVSRKQNTLGVGKKQHRTSDMWWMNAFDSSLKGLDTSKEGIVVQTISGGGLDMVARGGGKYVGKTGLYASFVRGECLSGTITPEEREAADQSEREKGSEGKESKEERRKRKAEKRAAQKEDGGAVKKPEPQSSLSQNGAKNETKEERRARKLAKRAAKEQESSAEELPETGTERAETKEERKERKRLKRSAQEEMAVAEDLTEKPKKKKRRKE